MPGLTPKGRDDLVMGTNNSSIVSKRSVERIYFPDEPQYFRFFVKKYQRRAPLINRGYHLRMHLIDTMVRKFLSRPSSKSKVVVNLGCGSDPLPWRSMFRHAEHCGGAKFVDIDFPDLLALKRNIVERTPELQKPLTDLEFPKGSRFLVKSDQYCQIACDLRQLSVIHEALSQAVDVPNCEFLFVAEVSITYMDVAAADALIRWAGTLGDVEFCLLEQILPDGPSSPFAQTMLQHFNKLNTPIKCIHDYPTTGAQQGRFGNLGWSDTRVWTMWEAWSDPLFMSTAERQKLDGIEVFDEWEEFANFASHYFLLYARNGDPIPEEFRQKDTGTADDSPQVVTASIALGFSPVTTSKSLSSRRFGSPLIMRDILGQQSVANFFGFGADGRLRSCDLYSNKPGQQALALTNLHQGGPAARSCFTLTDLGDSGYLLVGGRASPAAPFNDTWLFKKDTNQWARTHDLPVPLFRHSAVRLGDSHLVLLAGGKSGPTTVHPHYLLYHPNKGWIRCAVRGTLQPPALFGSLLLNASATKGNSFAFRGILSGGMTGDGLVSRDVVDWALDISNIMQPTIRFEPTASSWAAQLLGRFGALSTQVDGWTVVAGGVIDTGSVLQDREVVRFRDYGEDDEAVECLEYISQLGKEVPRPVLVGASIIGSDNGEVTIIGGGMTSFSMGTVWSEGIYAFGAKQPLSRDRPTGDRNVWRHLKTLTVTNEEPNQAPGLGMQHTGSSSVTSIPRIKLNSGEQFKSILQGGKPVVFEGLDLGDCLTKWDLNYLAEHVGPERKVVVHASTTQAMDFLSKNFRYNTQTFQEFVKDVDDGKRLYLRALSADKPSDAPAELDVDFPTISGDFVLPPQLAFAKDKLFSSVLRISGPVNMWLHYDVSAPNAGLRGKEQKSKFYIPLQVLANAYCQIQGSKCFYLFPPSDVTQLGFAPGASSSSIDVFSSLASSSLSRCHPHETVVGPGDVLFLPQLWMHTATPISNSSVAVNVFFRDLENGYSSGRDVYGNRDLAAYEKARQDVYKISNSFKDVPRDTREFYLRRIADELLQAASE